MALQNPAGQTRRVTPPRIGRVALVATAAPISSFSMIAFLIRIPTSERKPMIAVDEKGISLFNAGDKRQQNRHEFMTVAAARQDHASHMILSHVFKSRNYTNHTFSRTVPGADVRTHFRPRLRRWEAAVSQRDLL